MKKITLLLLMTTSLGFSQISGTWKMSPVAGALGVGQNQGDISWWSSSIGDITGRACYFDDLYVFNEDGSFQNVLGADTWIEGWQGGLNSCGTPVAPHDGSNAATWAYDSGANTITLTGVGAYIGLPKAFNGGELASPAAAPASITYTVTDLTATTATLDISIGGGWWRFLLEKQALATTNFQLANIKMYPNPASTSFTINANDVIEKVSVHNVLGQEVISKSVNNKTVTVDIAKLQVGIYVVKATINGVVSTSKIIKE